MMSLRLWRVTVRAFPCVEQEGGNYYTTISHVVEDPDLQENISEQIERSLRHYREKGRSLRRFAQVWRAVDALK